MNFPSFRPNRLAAAVLALLAAASPVRADDCEAHLSAARVKAMRSVRATGPIMSLSHKMTTTVQGITFNSNYDNGSLGGLKDGGAANTFTGDLYVEPGEPGGQGSASYWFRFQMTGVAGRTITINMSHSENKRPVISVNGGAFRRMTATEAPSLTKMVLTFGASENQAEVAFFFPLGYADIHNRVNALVAAGVGGTSQVLGQSYLGRDMWVVRVTDPSVPDAGKKGVWVHARAHAGEVTASHAMLGFLDQILENSPVGQRLRRNCVFNVVPTLNCDGVYLGLTRWESRGIDLEREWPTPARTPEVSNLKARVDAQMAGAVPIRVALNLHSTVSDFADTFFFRHLQPSVTANFETIQQNYIDAFNAATPLFNNLSPQTSQLSPTLFIESYFWNNWSESVMAMTHEGHYYERITDNQFITDADYRELGRAQAAGLIQYFNLPPLPSAVNEWSAY